jgi:hypothetical protein
MAAIHALGVHHGELRPENLLLAVPAAAAAAAAPVAHGGAPTVASAGMAEGWRDAQAARGVVREGAGGGWRRVSKWEVWFSERRRGVLSRGRLSAGGVPLERPQAGRAIGRDAVVKIKDAGGARRASPGAGCALWGVCC